MDGQVTPPLQREVAFSLNQAAATYTLFTAVGDVVVEGLSIYCTAAAGAPLTSVTIQTNQTTPYIFLTIVEGAVGNLLAQSNLAMASQATGIMPQVRTGQLIQATIAGGASATGVLQVVVRWRPLSGNGLLI